jgi:aspartate beta-hydroxylase
MTAQRPKQAAVTIEALLARSPGESVAWLMLGQVREGMGESAPALRAYFNAVTRAQRNGQWIDEASTPPQLLSAVLHAVERVRNGRRELLFDIIDETREAHGAAAVARVDRALRGYLREWDSTPVDSRQRPKFFFFAGLPNTPYHDPYLQPWARQLRAAFPEIREEAVRVVEEDRRLPNFIPDNLRVEDFVSGVGSAPSWEAFFFYRHGQRYDGNHARCPKTSAVLESIDLCRIEDQAPEILFSVLKPGSHINAHHGVTNVRLVIHLPLVVPTDCALNLVDRGKHHWREGQLVMFDDTYLHEAWNRSEKARIVLLMDCWNPHLTRTERTAVRRIVETITSIQLADRATRAATQCE